MLQRDYLMKMIEQMAQVLARLIGLREAGRYNDATELIDQTLAGFFKFDGQYLKKIEADDLLPHLAEKHELNEDQLTVLSELLCAQGDVLADKNEELEAQKSWLKALNIFQHLNESQPAVYDYERVHKISYLENKLS